MCQNSAKPSSSFIITILKLGSKKKLIDRRPNELFDPTNDDVTFFYSNTRFKIKVNHTVVSFSIYHLFELLSVKNVTNFNHPCEMWGQRSIGG